MENLTSIMERDYGFKSGKNAPMVSSSSGGGGGGGSGYGGLRKSVPSGRSNAFGQEDPFGVGRKSEGSKSGRSSYGSREDLFSASSYHDVFGGPPKSNDGAPRYDEVYSGAPQDGSPAFDDQWGGFGGSTPKVKSSSGSFHSNDRPSDRNHFASSEPVYDELLPGFGFMPKSRVASETRGTRDPDPFAPLVGDPVASSSAGVSSAFDDGLLPGYETETRSTSGDAKTSREPDPLMPIFDEPISSSIPSGSSPFVDVDDGLLPGFDNEDTISRSFREPKVLPKQDSFESVGDDPMSSGIPGTSPGYDDLLNVFDEPQVPPSSSSSRGLNGVKVDRFDGMDSFPSSPLKTFFKDSSRKTADDGSRLGRTASTEEAMSAEEGFKVDDMDELSPDSDPFFSSHLDSGKSATLGSSEKQAEDVPGWDFPSTDEQPPRFSANTRSKGLNDAWLTVEDLKLYTRPSPVPPPSRRPPSLPGSKAKLEPREHREYREPRETRETREPEFVTSSSSTSTPEDERTASKSAPPSYEQSVPGWMDFKPARDVERRDRRRQEREEARAAKESRDREIEEREAKQAKDAIEARELVAKQTREQERLRREKEREKDRAAVRIATLEARQRAAQEAQAKQERNAVERATAEARVRAAAQARARAERAAADRAAAEARERAEARAAADRAAAEARERLEKAASEKAEKAAVERAAAEVRERAMRAASEKAQSEARERAARLAAEKAAAERVQAEARERAEKLAAEKAARERQQQNKSENDLESFFAHPAASESRRHASMNNVNNAGSFNEPRRTSSGTATTTGSVDDWASIFGSASNSDVPQDSRRADNSRSRRNERNLHTSQRAAKAIAEINQRDRETQREQAERDRAADVLDGEIKRWAAGKEGNLRALLSTMQYVLWPESGWSPVSLTDLINPAAVKKTYKKATLYVHPDKVQQKGATVQQKYIAEKVFDLLKDAFNKFNSEELF